MLKMSHNGCSVSDCKNRYNKCPEGTVFYSFPSELRFPGRKQQWVKAVKRFDRNKSRNQWVPSKYSKICSNHFINGAKSDHPHHPSYIPTIFGKFGMKSNPMASVSRFERSLERNNKKINVVEERQESSASFTTDTSGVYFNTSVRSKKSPKMLSIGLNCCLTEDSHLQNTCEIPVLFCSIFENDASTQTMIPAKKFIQTSITNQSIKTEAIAKQTPEKMDVSFADERKGFLGIISITNDVKLKELAGVPCNIFSILCLILKANLNSIDRKMCVENSLLIFLMKMKLGVSHAALAVIFGVHQTTISTIFVQVLGMLVLNTSNWLYWPERKKVRTTLPEAFKSKFSNCRAIIDCTEIKTECPPTEEQQLLMYSSCKNAHTVKYLVGITPAGFISFLSNGYGGMTSDCFITNHCGILNLVEKGDLFLADKGFPTITSILNDKAHGDQFAEETDENVEIASVRKHVQRCIQRLELFGILQRVESDQLPIIDDIVRMCCVLANMQAPIV